ncbi:hypothetical protein ACFVYE_04960 [Streptomyces sp. NPDC058239]|uniref:hypothetical protein n=1 Tax=Streptomyces sp. NPDC058239 TaxID=3346395 RepID=UPI0036F0F10F
MHVEKCLTDGCCRPPVVNVILKARPFGAEERRRLTAILLGDSGADVDPDVCLPEG